jgi:hypothetical protein
MGALDEVSANCFRVEMKMKYNHLKTPKNSNTIARHLFLSPNRDISTFESIVSPADRATRSLF